MSKPTFIYVLTNPCFNKANLVKIGYTNDLKKRIKELSGTSVYSDFELYASYQVSEDLKKPDLIIHNMIEMLAPEKRLNSQREFFEMYPWEAADFLEYIAKVSGTTSMFKRYKDNVAGSNIESEEERVYTEDSLFGVDTGLNNLYYQIQSACKKAIGETAVVKPTKLYVSIKKGPKHNVFGLWPKNGSIEVVLFAKHGELKNLPEFVYDISNRLWTSAQYAFKFTPDMDLKEIETLLKDVANLHK